MSLHMFWISEPFGGRLAVARRPRGGSPALEQDVQAWRAEGLDMIVSMLEPGEATELGLAPQEQVCREHGITFINCPVRDHGVPDTFDTRMVLDAADDVLIALRAGKRVAAHCFAGMGRSPLFVASVLVRAGLDSTTAWERISVARRVPVPQWPEQRRWVEDLEQHLQAMKKP